MLVSCWSAKGGSGATVVAVALSLVLARRPGSRALLVDLAGDVPAALGIPEPGGPGLAGWCRAGAAAPADALARLEVPVAPGLALLARGDGPPGGAERLEVLASLLERDGRAVVVDCGTLRPGDAAVAVAGAATHSLLVIRPCYLALRRAVAAPVRPSGVVVVDEPGRALDRHDVEAALGVPVRAEVGFDPGVARAVDAGLLATRLPRGLQRSLRDSGVTGPIDDADPFVAELHHRIATEPAFGDDVVAAARRLVRASRPLLPADAVEDLVAAVVARVGGLGPLEPLLADPDVTEVMVSGGGRVHVERGGRVVPVDVRLDEPTVRHLAERIVAPLGLRVDRRAPMVDARLPDGSRVHVVLPPLAIDGTALTIRRFGARPVPLAAFASPPVVELLARAVLERRNIVVSGGTGAGKTTLLNALAGHLPVDERVITIEDAAELRLPGAHVVRLEARPANADGVGAVPIRDLVRDALRMRPDRLVVGEVRGGEALDMLQAMNTGHDGSLSTCHANGPDDALRRLETLALLAGVDLPLAAVREQLVAAVDLVVQVARRPDGHRVVVAVAEPDPDPVASGRSRCRLLADGQQVGAEPGRPARQVVT